MRGFELSPLDTLRYPIFDGGWPRHNVFDDMLNPHPSLPLSSIARDPFWYDIGLRPLFPRLPSYPSHLRRSYLSPIRRRYLWSSHPVRTYYVLNRF